MYGTLRNQLCRAGDLLQPQLLSMCVLPQVLFATCHDNDPLEAIRKSKGE